MALGSTMPTEEPTYRYLLCDLLSDVPIANLPLQGVRFGDRISRSGEFSATMNCTDEDTIRLAKLCQQYAGRGTIWVYRNGVLWWGGILWVAAPSWSGRAAVRMQLTASTFDSYAHHRYMPDRNYVQIGQNRIVESLWFDMQSFYYSDIGVTMADNDEGKLRDREYFSHDAETIGQRIEELSDVIEGPEVSIRVHEDADGNRVKLLHSAAHLGEQEPRVTFTSQSLVKFDEPIDATGGGTWFQTRGAQPEENAGVEQLPLMSDVFMADDLIEQGWPLLQLIEDHTSVRNLASLNDHAEALRARQSGAQETYSYTVRVLRTNWHPNQLGTPVRMRFDDLWHNPPVDRVVRPVAYTVTAADRSKAEEVQLDFDADEGGGSV